MSMDLVPAGGSGMVAREGFGERSIATTHETGTAQLVAAAEAETKSRFIMARAQPRSWAQVESRALANCKRRGFAEVALYSKPQGGERIVGPSVRLAEALFRDAGNVGQPTSIIYEDTARRMVRVAVIDYESNASYDEVITVLKTTERRNAKDRAILGERLNSNGQTVYIVEATEDEVQQRTGALASKARRNMILRLVPGDIVEACVRACKETIARGAQEDPTEARRRMVAGFVQVGVQPAELERYLGHPVDQVTPAEHVELRAIWQTLNDGEARWSDVLASRGLAPQGGAAPAEAGEGSAKVASAVERAKEAAAKAKESAKARAEAKAAEKAAAKAAPSEAAEPPAPTPEPATASAEREPGDDAEPDPS